MKFILIINDLSLFLLFKIVNNVVIQFCSVANNAREQILSTEPLSIIK